jgi:hypothetical protein
MNVAKKSCPASVCHDVERNVMDAVQNLPPALSHTIKVIGEQTPKDAKYAKLLKPSEYLAHKSETEKTDQGTSGFYASAYSQWPHVAAV